MKYRQNSLLRDILIVGDQENCEHNRILDQLIVETEYREMLFRLETERSA